MVRPHPFINKKNPHVSQHPQSHGISVLGYCMWPCFLLNPYLISRCRPEKPTCYAAEPSERHTKKAGRPMNAHGPRPHEHSELLSSWLLYDSWSLLSREGWHFTLSLERWVCVCVTRFLCHNCPIMDFMLLFGKNSLCALKNLAVLIEMFSPDRSILHS